MRTLTRLAGSVSTIALLAACTTGASPSASGGPASPSAAASAAPPSASADPCAAENLETVTDGTLTIGTDNPAFPPYFDFPADGETATPPWELGDPTNGRGFESAFAYALAEQLGFAAEDVEWVVVPFANSFAPGPKSFDIDINQVSFKPERTEGADLSDGYYFLNQSLVTLAEAPIASATSIPELKDAKFGAQVGTTSYDTIVDVIAPSQDPNVYDTNDAAVEALKAGQIDGLVVDLPTAFFVTAVQVEGGKIVGQFAPPDGAEQEHFSVVLDKGSPLTECVNAAIADLDASGELEAITQEWLADKANAPVLEP